MITRRDFLRSSLRSSTLVALAPTVPGFLERTARAAVPTPDGRVLVVVQLDGGNDGINTVVPFADEGYARSRTTLRLSRNKLHKITGEIGLHPAMAEAAKLLEGGRLAVVQGVGYPNPSRSHFKSMAIWHSAKVDFGASSSLEADATLGWIGRALDGVPGPADGAPAAQFVGSGSLPAALRGRRSVVSAVARPEDSILTLNDEGRSSAREQVGGEDLAGFVCRSTLDAYASSRRMEEVLRADDRGANYPATGLASRLHLIARMIKTGGASRVYYTTQAGYDTHHVQLLTHATLLGELSGALKAFLDDLGAAGLAERVLVVCFSEFGRRVRENGSQGTDHGTAGPVLLAGSGVTAGMVGLAPRLLDLEDGDLKMTTDFRRVYAAVLKDWLGLPSKTTLEGDFTGLELFKK
jgi:uncharacterized protein (DUF1501 family)